MTDRSRFLRPGVCAATGLLGGALSSHVGHGVERPALGVAAGVVFWLAFARRRLDPASGLLWGAALAFPLWLATLAVSGAGGTAIDHARAAFPELVADVVALGVPIGLALGALDDAVSRDARPPISLLRAIACGGGAGLAGGWAFGAWMARVGFFPLVAGLVGSRDPAVGAALHFAIAVAIGASFGLLFQREIRGVGSGIAYGVGYGLVWWFAGPLTLLPAISRRPVDWSAAGASSLFGSLVGHVVYGIVVGTLYGVANAAWKRFFLESDPLAREPSGAVRTLESVGRGAVASLAGGAVFSVVMFATGTLPRVASLVGGTSVALGLVVHMAISAIIGASYGFLFRYEAPDAAASLAWGLTYGAVWWFLGPLTLFPVLLGRPLAWSAADAAAQAPSLLGHLFYGGAMALAFLALEGRYRAYVAGDERLSMRERRRTRPPRTSAPAVWLIVVGLGVSLAVVLA